MAVSLKDKRQLTFNDHWPTIRPIILKMLHQESVTRIQWQDLFWLVHSVCLWDDKGPQELYRNLEGVILDYTKQAQMNVLAHQEEQALLKAYIAEWRKFFSQCHYVSMPFWQLELALEGHVSVRNKGKGDPTVVRNLTLNSWKKSIFSNIKHILHYIVTKLVNSERNGEAFDSQLIVGVRESYVSLCPNSEDRLQIYKENFEKAYMDATEDFYRAKAFLYLEANGVQNYMKYVDQKLKEEDHRATKYLEPYSGSLQLLTECCVRVLVANFKDVILPECPEMIKNNEKEKLQLMFKLVDKVPDGIIPMLEDLEQHIVNQGLADMVASAGIIAQDSEKYVEQLLKLFIRFSELVKDTFKNDPRFLTSRDKAFNHIVNDTTVFRLELHSRHSGIEGNVQPESRCPVLLANYCDMLLRQTPLSKKLTTDEIESKLKHLLLILKYVRNKDVFMMYYKAHLTRRLILKSSADSEMEENMVEWLRDVGVPAGYINKLSRMFQDVKISADFNQDFKYFLRNKGGAADSINIKILNVGAWFRGSECFQMSLPLELEDVIPEVEELYRQKHSGKKLQWHHQLSNGTITFRNKSGKFDLDVTTFQMAVLFSWNERNFEKISFENLKLSTGLPEVELRRTLWSLVVLPKLKRQILLYSPEANSPKDFDDGTLFWVNQEFLLIKNSKHQARGKVNLIGRLQLSTDKCKEKDNESIVNLRIFRTQEAIVKIMKTRKKMSHAQLQTELVDILKNMFLPTKKMIKEQIEWLIEHKYVKRDEDNVNVFTYMA